MKTSRTKCFGIGACAVLLGLSLLISLFTGVCVRGNVGAAEENYDAWDDEEYEETAGEGLTHSYDPQTEYVTLGGFSTYDKGYRMAYYEKVRLDGATIYLDDPSLMQAGDRLGFMLGNNKNAWYGPNGASLTEGGPAAGFTVVAFRGWNGGNAVNTEQTSVGIDLGYEISAETCIGYKSTENMEAGTKDYGYGTRIVTSSNSDKNNTFPSDWGMAVSFEHVTETVGEETDYWKVTFTELYSGLFLGSGFNNRTGTDAQGRDYFTAYVKGSSLDGIIDENGDVYVIAFGIDRDVTEAPCKFRIRIEDDHTKEADAKTAEAEEKFVALSALIAEADQAASFDEYAAAYEAFKGATAQLKANSAKKYAGYLAQIEDTFKTNTNLQAKLADFVGKDFTAAEDAMKFEDGFSSQALESAKTAIAAASAALEKWQAMLSEQNVTEIGARVTALAASVTEAEKTLTFIGTVAAFDTDAEKADMFEALRAAYELYAGLDEKEQQRSETAAILELLNGHAAAYNEFVADVNGAYNGMESAWCGLSE